MKKNLFLMLTLIGLSIASVKAQVLIGGNGTTDEPHAGAILDLSKTAGKGLLLPKVDLQGLNVFTVAAPGEGATAGGMVVYNTAGTWGDEGVYVWDGAKWSPVGVTPSCTVAPATPGDIGFSKNTINLGEELTISVDAVDGAISYIWSYPTNLFTATPQHTSTPSITLTAKESGGFTGANVSVLALNLCGPSASNTGNGSTTITVNNCAGAPATPGAIRFTPDLADGVNLNGTVTAEIDAVATATSYVWSISPAIEGLVIEGDDTGTSVTLRASTPGAKDLSSLSVLARNDCDDSAPQPATGTITVRDCTGAPTGGLITGLTQTVEKDVAFTLSVSGVSTSGNTTYLWNTPTGFTLVGPANQPTVQFSASATVTDASVTCTITNECDYAVVSGTATVTVNTLPAACDRNTIGLFSGVTYYFCGNTYVAGCGTSGGTRPPCGSTYGSLGGDPVAAPWSETYGQFLYSTGSCGGGGDVQRGCFLR
ncbi:MAG: hypothetical protein LBO74_09260 [Candidatus Symbiothrix sp.]|jgi:hypothetical protein|nr:hypothetical protein [Candidatus Symbiothrix sp.]